MTRAPTYLKQRKKGWYVQLPIPKDSQAAMGGKKLLERTLSTRDEVEAYRRRHAVIADLQAQIAQAVAAADGAAPREITPEALEETARAWRAAVDSGEQSSRDAHPAFDALVGDFMDKKARSLGMDSEGHPRLPEGDEETIRRAYKALHGNPALTLGYQAERYLRQHSASELRRQTLDDKRRHLTSFLGWAGRDTECKKISRARASAYFEQVILVREVSVQTKKVSVGAVRQFFEWLEAEGLVTLNPFLKVGKILKQSTRGKEPPRRSWTSEELFAVLRHFRQSDPLWPLAVLGAFTGARLEDICALRAEDARDGVFVIRDGKTRAAVRRVPVHPVIRPMVDRLVAKSPDKYLLPGLLTGGSDDKRGHYIGKRFGPGIRRAGVTDPRVVFHSFRRTVLTQLDIAGVPLPIRQQIVGHEQQGVTLRFYTDPADDARLAEALAPLTYGSDVDQFIRSVGAGLTITHVSRRRKK